MNIHFLLKLSLICILVVLPAVISYIKTKNLNIAILSSLLFSLGFNIAYHFISPDSYINGRLIYYKIPTIHIIDILCLLITIYIAFKKRLSTPIALILVALCIPLAVHFSYPALSYTLKYILYLITAFSISNTYSKKEIGIAVKFGLFPMLCLNLIVALYQVVFRHSLGLNIIGESIIDKTAIDIAALSIKDIFIVRGYGFLSHPNVLAGLSLFTLIISDKTTYSKTFSSVIRIICSIIICLTLSKAGIFLLVLYWILKLTSNRYHGVLLLLLTLTATAVIGVGVYTSADFVRIRIEQVDQALLHFTSNLPKSLLGTGITGFLDLSSIDPIIQKTGTYFIQPIHNILLSIIVEYGVFCIGWGVLIAGFISTRLQLLKQNPKTLFTLLFVIVIGLFDHYFLTIPTGIFLFCMILALSRPKFIER